MEFKTEVQRSCYEDVAVLIRQICGDTVHAREDDSAFQLRSGSAGILIIVYPWDDDSATICVQSRLVEGANFTPELARFLLDENAKMRFGAFSMTEQGDVFFEHTILGPTCDKEELGASIAAVAITADKYDDEIVSRWGGRKTIE